MKNTHQLSIAALVVAGFAVTGCSQQQIAGGGASQVAGGSQQMAGSSQVQTAPEQKVIVKERVVVKYKNVCKANCAKPRPRPRPTGGHTHPAVPGCTNSVRHFHKFKNRNHRHAYSCKKSAGKRYVAPRRYVAPKYNKWAHTHPAVPGCTKSVRHTHKYNARNHRHSYSCKGAKRTYKASKPPVDVYALQRKLKAKGYYKGPIDGIVGSGTRGALQRFMQNRR